MIRSSRTLSCGIDFGTSNSTLTLVDGDRITPLALGDGPDPVAVPTLMHFAADHPPAFGAAAIAQYIALDHEGRLVQSIKRHLPAATFRRTWLAGRSVTIEELVASFLRWLKEQADAHAGRDVERVILGRPARYHEDPERDRLAEDRMARAARLAGFAQVGFQMEPIAAARRFERELDDDILCLVGDLGGGTSDFTVIRLSPRRSLHADRSGDVLGVAGVSVGGNDFDTRLMQRNVLRHFGHGTRYRPLAQELPLPTFLHLALTRWHTMCLAGTDKNLALLDTWMRTARDRAGLLRLRRLLDDNIGFRLYQQVEATKMALSGQDHARLCFRWGVGMGRIDISEPVGRATFEDSIAREIGKVERCLDDLLGNLSLHPRDISAVFLTGGSSRVPRVRALFAERFGDRIVSRDALTSVGHGLGLEAAARYR